MRVGVWRIIKLVDILNIKKNEYEKYKIHFAIGDYYPGVSPYCGA
jgi:hypothetical protein